MTPTNAQTNTSDAPYLYYFSTRLKAFVIERADGTDTRLLVAGAMDEDHPNSGASPRIDGSAFSPSGKWFTWSAAEHVGGGNFADSNTYLVRTDGTERSLLTQGLRNAITAWSPGRDVLAALTYTVVFEQDQPRLQLSVVLIDPEKNTRSILKRVTYSSNNDFELRSFNYVLRWLNDHQVLAVYPAGSKDDYYRQGEPNRFIAVVFDTKDQSPSEHIFDQPSNKRLQSSIPYNSIAGDFLSESTTNARTYYLNNVADGSTCNLDVTPRTDDEVWMYWSPYRRMGILVSKIGTDSFGAWIVDPATCQTYPAVRPVAKERGSIQREGRIDNILEWSPDGNFAALLLNGRLHAINLANRTSRILQRSPQLSRGLNGIYGWNQANQIITNIEEDERDETSTVTLFDSSDGLKKDYAFNLTFYYHDLEMSPDKRYLAAYRDGLVVVNTVSKQVNVFSSSASGFNSAPIGFTRWSADSQWIMYFDSADDANSGGYWIGVSRPDGTNRRELGYTRWFSNITADWLPSHVTESLLPSVELQRYAQPVKQLRGAAWITALNWDQDGRYIRANTFLEYQFSTLFLRDYPSFNPPELTSDGNIKPVVLTFDTQKNDKGFGLQNRSFIIAYTDVNSECDELQYKGLVSPDGQYSIKDNALYVAKNGRLLRSLTEDYFSYVECAAFTSDSRYLAVSGQYNTTVIYQIEPWKELAIIPHGSLALAFSPDDQRLAVASGWDIEIYNVIDLID